MAGRTLRVDSVLQFFPGWFFDLGNLCRHEKLEDTINFEVFVHFRRYKYRLTIIIKTGKKIVALEKRESRTGREIEKSGLPQ